MAELLHNKVEQSLRAQGMRYTSNRRKLVSALEDTSGPLTVDQLYRATKQKVPFSSIYREVRALFEAEVLSLIHSTDRSNRFELAEWLAGHHHHMVCVRCMAISDVALSPRGEHRLAELVDRAATDTGYMITDHTLEIEGVCPDCQS
ncbi:MAG: transcriptional repressor [Actinomycetia bacterium]|nr:transcriptional repressor [Actinomycetes bacterium]